MHVAHLKNLFRACDMCCPQPGGDRVDLLCARKCKHRQIDPSRMQSVSAQALRSQDRFPPCPNTQTGKHRYIHIYRFIFRLPGGPNSDKSGSGRSVLTSGARARCGSNAPNTDMSALFPGARRVCGAVRTPLNSDKREGKR